MKMYGYNDTVENANDIKRSIRTTRSNQKKRVSSFVSIPSVGKVDRSMNRIDEKIAQKTSYETRQRLAKCGWGRWIYGLNKLSRFLIEDTGAPVVEVKDVCALVWKRFSNMEVFAEDCEDNTTAVRTFALTQKKTNKDESALLVNKTQPTFAQVKT